MALHIIRVRGTRAEALKTLRQIPKEARGNGQAAQAMLVRMGMELLARIRDAFVTKARGGTDESGLSWPKLSPKTIAYKRRHPGLPPAKQRAKKRPSYALSDAGRKKWWANYSHYLGVYKGDKGHAASAAWLIAKEAGEKTLLEQYGGTSVEILRDLGLLLNSLSPGVQSANQIFRKGPGELIVGTNRKGAAGHHKGIPGRLPQRRLWPSPDKWPKTWWTGILEQARGGLIDVILSMFRRKGK